MQLSAQPVHLLHKPFSTQYCYFDSIHGVLSSNPEKIKIPDIQFSIIWAKRNNIHELAALLELLMCGQISNQSSSYIQDSVEKEMVAMLTSYANRSKYIHAEILQNLGYFYYFVMNKNNLSFEHYLQSYNEYKEFDPISFPGKRKFIYELGGSYFRFGEYRNAIKFMKEALATKLVCGEDFECTSYNTIGLSYQALNIYDSAFAYYQLGKQAAVHKKNETWTSILDGNIGSIYFLKGQYDKAIPMLEQSVDVSLAHTQRRNALNSICLLADACLSLNNKEKAEQSINKADSLLRKFSFLRNHELTSHLWRIKAKLYAAKGDAGHTYLYADSAMTAMDSLKAEQIASNQMKTNDREQYVQQKYEKERIESEREWQLLLRNALIVLIIFMMVIAILIINRQRLLHKKLEADKKFAESELAVATTKLFGFRQRESEKDELIEQLKKEDEEQEELQGRIQLENAILLTDEQWDGFRRQFEKVHPGFFSNLKREIPDLTPSEVRFLALTKLKLSPKEMTAMLGVSLNAIRVYRYRLRKRLNLDKDQAIEDLVEQL